MNDTWDRRIERARELGSHADAAPASLLDFYARLLSAQKDLYAFLRTRRGWLPSGSLQRDLDILWIQVPALWQVVAANGPELLAAGAVRLLDDPDAAHNLLLDWWRAPSDRQFFPKAALQPYAQWLAEAGIAPVDRGLARADNCCPFCGGTAQLGILESPGDADGGGRSLLCATCLTPWPFRRVLCPYCGEENERKLGYFHASALDHLRVDACDSCQHYLKTVDLTRSRLAVPIVDEVAGAALDLWAGEHGYEKIELNLLGL